MSMSQIAAVIRSRRLRRMGLFRHLQKASFSNAQTVFPSMAKETFMSSTSENNKMLKIDPKGVVTPFATISEKGLGHLCFKQDRFYVTAFESHEIYEVTLNGIVKRIVGNGDRGIVNGAGAKARLSFPNGIAFSPWGDG